MNKILLWGQLNDEPMRQVHTKLIQLKANFDFIDYELIDTYKAHVSSGEFHSYFLECEGKTYNLLDYNTSYLRPHSSSEKLTTDDHILRQRNLTHHLLNTWAERVCHRVISRPSAEGSNHSKLYQAPYIRQAGFLTPFSIISNDTEQIAAFHQTYGSVIYKSMSSVRSIVKELQASDYLDLDLGPCLIQERIIGRNIRVHVLENRCFTSIVDSDQIDYRYSNKTSFTPYQLPIEIAQTCIRLSASLNLPFSGIDLILTNTQKWYCLEVNPNPGYTCFESSNDGQITNALADWLMNF